MKNTLVKLRQAADLKTEIAKQELEFWKIISRTLQREIVHYPDLRIAGKKPLSASTDNDGYMTNCLNSDQATKYLGVSRTMLYRLRNDGLKYVKVGKLTRYRRCDLDAFVTQNLFSKI